MKTLILFSSAIFIVNFHLSGINEEKFSESLNDEKNKQIVFTENKGQIHDQNNKSRSDILFGGSDGKINFYIRNSGVSYQLNRIDGYKEVAGKLPGKTRKQVERVTIHRIDLTWLNSNPSSSQSVDESLPGFDNYYLEHCPEGIKNVKGYFGVKLKNIYNKIDLHYYSKNECLKHDYIVAPFGDYKQIKIKVEGATIQKKVDGGIILKTPFGQIEEAKPIVFQNNIELKAEWKVTNNVLSFEIENYNPNYSLIIDPITRLWGTYYGGTGGDFSHSCITDMNNSVYMAGEVTTTTSTIIATSGAHQVTLGGGTYDAFLVKFNSAGVRQWGTYYGGSGTDVAYSCCVDLFGSVYIAGNTDTNTGTSIATPGSHQTTVSLAPLATAAFLVKFDASTGNRFWGTYYSGVNGDGATSCCTDKFGNVFMAGGTGGGATITSGGHQNTFGGVWDAFLVKFNPVGIRQWGTFYGGNKYDGAFSCCTDSTGNIFISGQTETITGTVIATVGSHQSVFGGATSDTFLAKFDNNGIRQWATYYGGIDDEVAYSCATDISGNIYLAGSGGPFGSSLATPGSHQTSLAGSSDAFLAKFNNIGVRQWCTYYGDIDPDAGFYCCTDKNSNIYLTGIVSSGSGTTIASVGSHQETHGGVGDYDAFLVKFNSAGVRLGGTFYGGFQRDYAQSCSADTLGNVYLTGYTSTITGSIIATPGSHQPTIGAVSSNYDAFLVKFKECNLSPVIMVTNTVCSGTTLSFSSSVSGTTTVVYQWNGPNSFTSSVQNPIINNINSLNAGTYTLTVNDGNGCIQSTSVSVTVNTTPTVSVNSSSICSGDTFTIVTSGASTYTIQGGSNIVNPITSTSYTVNGTGINGCISANIAVSNVTVIPTPTITVNSGSVCIGNSFTIIPNGATNYTIETGSAIITPSANSSYTVIGEDNGCFGINVATCNVVVNSLPIVTAISTATNFVCLGESGTLTANGASSYSWSTGGTGSSISVSPTITTNYSVTGTDSNGCTNLAVVSQSVDACIGIKELNSGGTTLDVFPNPNNGVFSLEVYHSYRITITDVLGKIIYSEQLSPGKHYFSYSEIATGIYFLEAKNKEISRTIKLLKQ